MKNLIIREPENLLPLSIRFAREYLDELCKMQNDIAKVQESKELTTMHRALWTALIMEVGRLFDAHNDVVSFKKVPNLKTEIDKCHQEDIIGKIIETRNTFTGHFATNAKVVVSAAEICKSRLGEILERMSKLSI